MTETTAAILTDDGEIAQILLEDFARALQSRGVKVGGLVQRTSRGEGGKLEAMAMFDLDSGTLLPIEQKLGASASCSVDPQALAAASQWVRRAIDLPCDLVVVNKFGHLEVDGGGLADETMLAIAEGRRLLLSVSPKYLERWQAFCGGMCELLAPEPAALEAWWGRVYAP